MSQSAPIILAGRRRSRVPTIEWKFKVPADIAVLVEEALPGRGGKTKYGARSELLEALLRRWLSENEPQGGFDTPPSPASSSLDAMDGVGPSRGDSDPFLSDKDFTR